ncbi:unnamed protein product [Rotaria magnacalcarata]
MDLTDDIIDEYRQAIGKIIVWSAYTSTTKDPRVAEMFANNTIVIITAKRDNHLYRSDISSLSRFPDEQEVLMDSQYKFHVDKIERDSVNKKCFVGVNNNEFEFPYFLALNENTKTLYISDYDNNRIMSYASGASVGTVAAGGNGFGTSYTQLEYPVGLYFDSLTNSLVVANSAAHNIVRWILGDNSWTQVVGISGIQGNSSSLLNLPMGVTFDPMGNMYVADAYNHRIQFFLSDQSEGRTIAGITSSPGMNDIQLNTPYSIRLDNQLNLYVVDLGNHRVKKFLRY